MSNSLTLEAKLSPQLTNVTLNSSPPKVRTLVSGAAGFHGVTGGVYKTRERIHRAMLMRDY